MLMLLFTMFALGAPMFEPIHGPSRVLGTEAFLAPGEAASRRLIGCTAQPFFAHPVSGDGAVLPDSELLAPILQQTLEEHDARKARGEDAYVLVDGYEDKTPFKHPSATVDDIRVALIQLADYRAFSRGQFVVRELQLLRPGMAVKLDSLHVRAPEGQRGAVIYVCSSVTPSPDAEAEPDAETEPKAKPAAESTAAAPTVIHVNVYPPSRETSDRPEKPSPDPRKGIVPPDPGQQEPGLAPERPHSRWGLDASLGMVVAAAHTHYWSPGALIGVGFSVTNLIRPRGLLALRFGYYFGDYSTQFPVTLDRSLRERVQHHGGMLALELFPSEFVSPGARLMVGGARETLFSATNERDSSQDVFTLGGGPSLSLRVYRGRPVQAALRYDLMLLFAPVVRVGEVGQTHILSLQVTLRFPRRLSSDAQTNTATRSRS